MTREEFDTIVKATCPNCARGSITRQRPDTKEWVHDFAEPLPAAAASPLNRRQGHTICMATHLRNSDIAKGVTGG